ncbi:hypothetical protein F5887DRAFT_1147419, partial [Amanita rubescens]
MLAEVTPSSSRCFSLHSGIRRYATLRRVRRFILKIISKIPIIPPSMIVTGVSIPDDRDYIGGGGFGRVFKGERSGEVVALKVLYKSENQVPFKMMWRSLKHKFILPFFRKILEAAQAMEYIHLEGAVHGDLRG